MKLSENAVANQRAEDPGRSWLRRAASVPLGLPLVVAIVAALLGAVVGMLIPPTYTAETRVVVESPVGLTPYSAAGFPVSARATAKSYAEVINVNRGAEIQVPDGVTLEAIHLPQSNVLQLQAHARTPEAAIAGATAAADAVMDKVNRVPTIEQLVADRSADAAEAYANTVVTGVQTEAAREAQAQLQAARQQLTQEVSRPTPQLRLIRAADTVVSDRVERAQAFAGIGFVLGFLGAATLSPVQRQKTKTALRAAWHSDRTYTP